MIFYNFFLLFDWLLQIIKKFIPKTTFSKNKQHICDVIWYEILSYFQHIYLTHHKDKKSISKENMFSVMLDKGADLYRLRYNKDLLK